MGSSHPFHGPIFFRLDPVGTYPSPTCNVLLILMSVLEHVERHMMNVMLDPVFAEITNFVENFKIVSKSGKTDFSLEFFHVKRSESTWSKIG